jgi:heme/copper-type cytochrome/quinol oxidase subunit 2
MRIIFLVMCAMAAAGVFVAMVCAVWTYRRANGPPYFHQWVVVELVWVLIPCVMFVALALPAAKLIVEPPHRQHEPLRNVDRYGLTAACRGDGR